MYKKYPDYCGPVLITTALSQFMSSLSLTGTYFDNTGLELSHWSLDASLVGRQLKTKIASLNLLVQWEWLDPCELLSDPQLTGTGPGLCVTCAGSHRFCEVMTPLSELCLDDSIS